MTNQGNESQQPYIHIESHNQQGGITAYQVNIQPGDRQLNTKAEETIISHLEGIGGNVVVQVTAVMGDGEAFRFGTQVKNFLISRGFEVQGVNQAIYTQPIRGVLLEMRNQQGVIPIIIGNQ